MARNLNFETLADEGEQEQVENPTIQQLLDAELNGLSRRWPKREVNPTVQMSLRTDEHIYEAFRALCKKERRTNGEMLEVLLRSYVKANQT